MRYRVLYMGAMKQNKNIYKCKENKNNINTTIPYHNNEENTDDTENIV